MAQLFVYLSPTPTQMAFTGVTNAHGPLLQQHARMHVSIMQSELEVTRLRQGLNLPHPRSRGLWGITIRYCGAIVTTPQIPGSNPVIGKLYLFTINYFKTNCIEKRNSAGLAIF